MKITIIGTGYVGIVTAVVMAEFGNQVVGLDIDEERILELKSGKAPIFEPGLQKLLDKGLSQKRLSFTTDYKQALNQTKVIFICVGTPPTNDGQANLSFVKKVVFLLASNLRNKAVIVLKSTVPPGSHILFKKILDKKLGEDGYYLASVPEFLREGSAVKDSLKPSRLIIGADNKQAMKILRKLHAPIDTQLLVTDIISAQMIKYVSNAFLAMKISFANGVARVCDALKADVSQVMDGVGLDPRIGFQFLFPGLGYGGSCFPKDVKAFLNIAKKSGFNFNLLKEVDNINKTQVAYVVDRVERIVGSLINKQIGILGLAFKPQTDDLREARSVVLIKALLERGAKVQAYDPVIGLSNAGKLPAKLVIKNDSYEAAKEADILFLVTEWPEFKRLNLFRIKTLMKGDLFVDGRNFFDPKKVKSLGFGYIGVGRR